MRLATAGIAAIVFALACGCEESVRTSDGRPMPPEPRAAPVTPDTAPVNAMALVLGPKPLDTNGNLRPDLIQMEVYLFAQPYPAPLWREGTFTFALYPSGDVASAQNPSSEPLRVWILKGELVEHARGQSLVGCNYALGLSLLEGGKSDDLGTQVVDLVARWDPTDGGPPVFLSGVRTISLAMPVVQPGR